MNLRRGTFILAGIIILAILLAGCTSSNPASTTPTAPAGAAVTTVVSAAQTTPACPDKLVWDGSWDSATLQMAGNHDLSTAWTKYSDRVYGDGAVVKMTQTCWDVDGTLSVKGINCEASFKGTINKNQLTGTWSGSKVCSASEDGRKFALTMAADNKSWLGDLYDVKSNPANFPPNWAGRRV